MNEGRNAPFGQAIVPTTATGAVVTTWRSTWQRVTRTTLQVVAGGGLGALVTQVMLDAPDWSLAYVIIASTAIVSFAQNECERRGWVPIILKRPAVGP